MSNKFSENLKNQILKKIEEGTSINKVSTEFNISKSTIYNWINEKKQLKKEYRTKHEISIQDYINLLRKYDKICIKLQVYKTTRCTRLSSLEERLIEIQRLEKQFSLRILCDVLEVSRSTYYSYLKRVEIKQTQIDDIEYKKLVKEIFVQSEERYGAKKIKVKLSQLGYNLSPRRIQRLMNEQNLKCNNNKTKREYPKEFKRQYYLNKLKGDFNKTTPNSAWVSDITYCKVEKENYYLCVIIDLFSRKIIAYAISNSMSSTLVSSTFLDAFLKRNKPNNLLFHSDQGSQYTSFEFKEKLREYNVKQSFSKPGCPYDNAVVESFFSSLKKEEIHRNNYKNSIDLKIAIESYINFYNNERPHQSLNMLTPNQKEEEYYKNASD